MPDAELIAKAKAGEVEAFGELYRRYLDAIYRYIRTRVDTDQDTEDLTEAVFLKAFEALANYSERGAPFGAYLYRIAANMVVDHYRKQKPVKPLEDAEVLSRSEAAAETDILQKESLREVKQALRRLAPHHQEIIRLRVLLEMPTKEVAQWMGRSPSSIRSDLHRALKALRQKLGDVDGTL